MSATAQDLPRDADADGVERFRAASWRGYERLLELRGDQGGVRIACLDGEIELMSPSRPHETLKSLIGSLVETFCQVRGIEYAALGSWTLKQAALGCGVEPDASYVFGTESAFDPSSMPVPHLAIEVMWTSGSLDKLEIYRRLGVPEVWVWRDGRLEAHCLLGEQFSIAPRSAVLPGLVVAELASVLDAPWTSQAVRAYRAMLLA
ncbi:MAG: Uma2 family endonuclease [Deltaproteobacteria bacterium]|nr:Uma2 family endonuclease [Deltaproteobacteria bacterium]MCB9787922.1 Uma2 family endonuclease [Deltaproteobacteria bacterium]